MASNDFFASQPPAPAPAPANGRPSHTLYGGGAPNSGGRPASSYGGGAAAPSSGGHAQPSAAVNTNDWYTPGTSAAGAGTTAAPGMSGGATSTTGGLGYGGGSAASMGGSDPFAMSSSVPAAGGMATHTGATGGTGPYGSSSTAGSFPASGSDPQLSGSIGSGPMSAAPPGAPRSGGGVPYPMGEEDYENEPPLMEELGINIPHIFARTKAVLLPVGHTSSIDSHLMDDDDLAGPLAFGLLLGAELLLTAKIHFGYIYGFGMFGCLAMSLMVNLMSPKADAVSAWRVMSILGYCLLPVNVLAAVNVLIRLQNRGAFGICLAALTILWCTVASTRLFERSCDMRDQRYLIAYPAALLYSCFVMITIF